MDAGGGHQQQHAIMGVISKQPGNTCGAIGDSIGEHCTFPNQLTGSISIGSNQITNLVAISSALTVGNYLYGIGIPIGTTVSAVGANSVTMSANSTITNQTLTFQYSPLSILAPQSDGRSWIHWGIAFNGANLVFEPQNIFCVAGSTSAHAITQLPQVLAAGVQVCFINTGVNDPTGGGVAGNILSLSQSLANIKTIVKTLKNAGIIPIIRLISPANPNGWSAAYRQQTMAFNEELKQTYGNVGSGVYLHDPYPLYLDPTSNVSAPRGLLTSDWLHPQGPGASLEGPALANVLVSAGFPKRQITSFGIGEAYDSVNGNTRGNLLNNNAGVSLGSLTGTTGTFNSIYPAAGIYSGLCASYFDITEISGTTPIVGSIETTPILVNGIATGVTYNRQVIAATYVGAETVRFRTSFTIASPGRMIAIGDVVYMEAEIEVLSANANGGVSYVSLIGNQGGSVANPTVTAMADNGPNGTTLLSISNQGKFVLRTPAQTLQTGVAGYICDVQFQAAAGTTGLVTVKIGQPRLIKKSALILTN